MLREEVRFLYDYGWESARWTKNNLLQASEVSAYVPRKQMDVMMMMMMIMMLFYCLELKSRIVRLVTVPSVEMEAFLNILALYRNSSVAAAGARDTECWR